MSHTCFQTTVRNNAGHPLNVGFLRRGKVLAANEELTIDGDPLNTLKKKRERTAYLGLLDSQDLVVIHSPQIGRAHV